MQDIRGHMECGRKVPQQWPQPRGFLAGRGLFRHLCVGVRLLVNRSQLTFYVLSIYFGCDILNIR